jgi:hypothetical protein
MGRAGYRSLDNIHSSCRIDVFRCQVSLEGAQMLSLGLLLTRKEDRILVGQYNRKLVNQEASKAAGRVRSSRQEAILLVNR